MSENKIKLSVYSESPRSFHTVISWLQDIEKDYIKKSDGYNVAVKALTAISECRVRRPNSVAEQALRDLGELDAE